VPDNNGGCGCHQPPEVVSHSRGSACRDMRGGRMFCQNGEDVPVVRENSLQLTMTVVRENPLQSTAPYSHHLTHELILVDVGG
jgi:hypothetical protein